MSRRLKRRMKHPRPFSGDTLVRISAVMKEIYGPPRIRGWALWLWMQKNQYAVQMWWDSGAFDEFWWSPDGKRPECPYLSPLQRLMSEPPFMAILRRETAA